MNRPREGEVTLLGDSLVNAASKYKERSRLNGAQSSAIPNLKSADYEVPVKESHLDAPLPFYAPDALLTLMKQKMGLLFVMKRS